MRRSSGCGPRCSTCCCVSPTCSRTGGDAVCWQVVAVCVCAEVCVCVCSRALVLVTLLRVLHTQQPSFHRTTHTHTHAAAIDNSGKASSSSS
jgi:hypothetical protein